MKQGLLLLALLSFAAVADEFVNGYIRSDGPYVAPHMRSSPNSTRFDNYSSQGNTNPYTGQRGSQRNEFSDQPAYNQGRNSGYNNPYGSDPYGTSRKRSNW